MIQPSLDLRSPGEQARDAGLEEEWRPVVGLEGLYEVSSFGRLRSLERMLTNGHKLTPKIKVVGPDGQGYAYSRMIVNGKIQNSKIHIRVAAAFIGPRPGGMLVHHKNGDRMDARVSNLEYVTYSQNLTYAYDMGRQPIGAQKVLAKLNDEKAKKIYERCLAGEPKVALAKEFGVVPQVIYQIERGNCWTHVTGLTPPRLRKAA